MARLLYRIGVGSARRPLMVLLAWLLVIAAGTAGMVSFGKPLSNEFELPDSEFGRVLDEVGAKIDAVSPGTGTVVLSTKNENGFTPEQKSAIRDTFGEWEKAPHVTGVVDPFKTQQTLDKSQRDIAKGDRDLTKGVSKLWDGAYKVEQLRWITQQGRQEINRLEANDPDNPALDARREGQVQLEKKLRQADRRIENAQDKVGDGRAELTDGRKLLTLSQGIRTVSEDGRTAVAQLQFDEAAQSISPEDRAEIPEAGEQLADAGVRVEYGQEIVQTTEAGGVGEVIGVVVAGIVLLIMLASLVLAGIPLTVAFIGVGSTLTGGMAATGVVTLHSMAPVLGAMLGLAVGIDYALFIVSRHRRQLADLGVPEPSKEQIRHSIGMAAGTAGNAVVVAGTTVVIALAALTVSGIPVLVQMGLLAALTVTLTVLVALTITPALLSLAGRRGVPKRKKAAKGQVDYGNGHKAPRWAQGWVNIATGKPFASTVLVVATLLLVAAPALSIRLGLPDGGSEPKDSTAYQAYSQVDKAFGAGTNGPIIVSAEVDEPISKADEVSTQLEVAEQVAAVPGVTGVAPVGISEDRKYLAFQVLPSEGPSAASTAELVDTLRTDVRDDLAAQDIELGVTGATVANIEVSEQLAAALPLYLTLVVGLSMVLLAIVFRSLVVPVLATAGFLLSVAASFGAIVAVYQWGWGGEIFGVTQPGAIMSFMPTLLIGILFGLAMDYQMFLVSGMHEAYAHGQSARRSVRTGFLSGATVVFAAALIMISVFAGFVHSPMTMARPIGFGLAVGVFIDAFLIRMTLVPAAMTMLGDRAWWMPTWLERILPHLDVEGSSLVEENRTGGPRTTPPTDGERELDPVGSGPGAPRE